MRSLLSRVLVAAVLLAVAARADAAQFKHPSGAYTLPVPDGWVVQTFIDSLGYAVHFFGPEKASRQDETGPGLRIHAVPIPPGRQAELSSYEEFAVQIGKGTRRAQHLRPDRQKPGTAMIGPLPATALPLCEGVGTPVNVDATGELRFALGKEYLFVCHVWGGDALLSYRNPGASWKQVREKADAALNGLKLVTGLKFTRERPQTAERLEDAAARAKASIPRVRPWWRLNTDERKKAMLSGGSGVIVTADGYVLTNRHVVERDRISGAYRQAYDPVQLEWAPEAELEPVQADVVAVSYTWDLALLKIQGNRPWSPAPFADPAQIRQGQKVMVAGWPVGLSVTPLFYTNDGALTAIEPDRVDKRPAGYFHSARTNNGNSGGVLYSLDLDGVIGIHNSAFTDDSKGFRETIGHGAVPVARVFEEFPQLIPGATTSFTPEERLVRMATYYHQRRQAAALTESARVLKTHPKSGLASAFNLRILSKQQEPEDVLAPFEEAAKADSASRELAVLFRGRGLLEAANWTDLDALVCRVVKRNANPFVGDDLWLPALEGNDITPLATHEIRILGGYAAGSFHNLKENVRITGGPASAEVEMLIGIQLLREWLLKNKVTAPSENVRPSAALAADIERRLLKGEGLPPCQELALIHRAILQAVMGRPENAGDTFARALAGGRRDPFFLSLAAYYSLLTRDADGGYRLAVKARRDDSPGTRWLMGWSLVQFADVVRRLDPKNKAEVAQAARLLEEIQNNHLISAVLTLKDAPARLEEAGNHLSNLALIQIDRGRKYRDYPDLVERREKRPGGTRLDNWWGPFVYLHHQRDWTRR